ncbi:MAG: hypothetical protein WBN41_08455 [Lysobacterales bacterium]
MTENLHDIEWVDRYIRNQLSAEEEAEFEVRMLQSKELQQHLQTAMALKESLKLDEEIGKSSARPPLTGQSRMKNRWRDMAIAASVMIALGSSAGLVVSRYQTDRLEQQIAELNQPATAVLLVPVHIMRSSEPGSSHVIVQKPPGRALIQLDIELSGQALAQAQPFLQFALVNDKERPVLTWQASPLANGRATVLLRNDQVPAGNVRLEISDQGGNVLERHLLEFR